MTVLSLGQRSAAGAVALLMMGSLSACSGSSDTSAGAEVVSTPSSSMSPNREAGLFTKDVRICMSSIVPAAIKLKQSSSGGRKVLLKQGERQCFEGNVDLIIDVESATPNKFLQVQATNSPFTTPAMAVCSSDDFSCYGDNNYFERGFVEGETGAVQAEGRGFEMVRLPDTDFKEFQVLITL
jgi:hypothetical protein